MINNAEVLYIIDSLSRDKGIPKNNLIGSLEYALEEVSKKKYGAGNSIKAKMNHATGEIKIYRILDVVEQSSNKQKEISLEKAKLIDHDINLGEQIYEPLPTMRFGRTEIQSVREIFFENIYVAEQKKIFNDFKDKIGEVVMCIVQKKEFNNFIVEIGKTEARIPKSQLLPTDKFKIGDYVKAYVSDVRYNKGEVQIVLSRTNKEIIVKLLEREVKEIQDGTIEIIAIAREPGIRSKVAVLSHDTSIEPIGCVVGRKGIHLEPIMNEFYGEKIEVVNYSNDLAQYVINALSSAKSSRSPVNITKIVIDEDNNQIKVIVPQESDLSFIIGKKGLNIKLTSKLLKWNIVTSTEEEESKKNMEIFHENTKLLMEQLDLEETLAQLMVVNGFSSAEKIAESTTDQLLSIDVEGFDQDLAKELNDRAKNYIASNKETVDN